ncbi:MAG: DUF58 domain-containing protein [Planctomycetia bacterium]|nr:DUF58 domain-containing protein [Planctomycetia bacterium]
MVESRSNIFDPTTLAQLKSLKLRAQRLASGLSYGAHASMRLGYSTDYLDHAPWEEGNDPKLIDWRVFARTNKLFQRRYIEDTDASFYFMLDFSKSMTYRGAPSPLSKLEYAQSLAAALVFLAINQQDQTGISIFDENKYARLRPASGETHWGECLRFLEAPPLDVSQNVVENFSQALNFFASDTLRRGYSFIFTDFLDVSLESLRPQWRELRAKRQNVVVFHILDTDEIDFPFESYSNFVALEGSEQPLTLNASEVRDVYQKNVAIWRKRLAEECARFGIEIHTTLTNAPLSHVLHRVCAFR